MAERTEFRFVHAADLHIDSPLRGLEYLDQAPIEQLRSATRTACEHLIDLCVEQQVDFLILAGDLFDGPWLDVTTGLWTAHQFRRLEKAGIAVYLLRGNHDAANEVRHVIRWPDNVKQFEVDRAVSFVDHRLGVAVHGQGFAQAAVLDDLAATYPAAIPGMFNIGVLHTSLTGDAQHDTYAATSPEILAARGYDYWALGHIHARRTVCQRPFIAFSGNTQGRHIRECGAKGCLLVTVRDRLVDDIAFVATDVVRWEHLLVEVRPEMELPQIYDDVKRELANLRNAAEGRFLAIRVTVRGPCTAHWELVRPAEREAAAYEIRNIAASIDGVWIERVLFETYPPVNLAQLRQGRDLVGDLLRAIDDVSQNDAALNSLMQHFSPLADKAPLELAHAAIRFDDPQQLRTWLRQAEALLVGMLAQPTSASGWAEESIE